jgi:hypothetical protein
MRKIAYKGYWVYENGTIEGKNGIRKISLRPDGYLQLTMMNSMDYTKRINYMHHKFVWEAFNGPVIGDLHVDHIDGNKANNHLSNLRLLSPVDNMHNRRGIFTQQT